MAGISKKRVKNKKGKEIIKYVITYRDIYGKQHTSGSYNSIKTARLNLDKFDTKHNTSKILTIDEITDIYIDSRIKKNKAKTTIKNYEYYNSVILKYFKNVKYTKITPYDWQEWLFKIREEYSSYVADGCYKLLRAAFKYNKRFKRIIENTFLEVEPIELPKTIHNHFDTGEIINLLNKCKKIFPDDFVMLFSFFASGGREGEIFGLKKCYVDFDNDKIDVVAQYTHGEYKEKLKTEKSRRTWYMFPYWKQLLKEHINNDKTNSEYVFHNKKGNPLNPSNVRQRFWMKLLKACGYSENYARIHDMRGSNSDLSIALGLSITYTSESLGHYDPETTRKYYNQNNQTMIKDAINKYEEFFKIFGECELNVSQERPTHKTNVIQFPKRQIV